MILRLAADNGADGITSQEAATLLGVPIGTAGVMFKRLRSETVETVDRPPLLTRTARVRQSVNGRSCVIHTITEEGLNVLSSTQPHNLPDNPTKKEE